MKEQISAVVDNEIQDDQWLDSLLESDELTESWQRYHLIGDVMRGEHTAGAGLDIASKVALALEEEPTVLAPQSGARSKGWLHHRGKVVHLFSRVGHYAIAATVAGVVILGVQQYGSSGNIVSSAPVLETTPFSGSVAPVSLSTADLYPAQRTPAHQETVSEEELLQQKQRINAFLQDHRLQQRVVK